MTLPQSTHVLRRAGETKVLDIVVVVLLRVQAQVATVRAEAGKRHLRKHNAYEECNANAYDECNDNDDDGDDPHNQGC